MSLAGRAEAWSLSGQLVAGWIPFPSRLADNQRIEDPARPRLDLGLSTLAIAFARGDGPGVELQLPLGIIGRTDTVNGAQADFGIGDLEVRGRYGASLGAFRLTGAAGLAVPTGSYAARSGVVGLQENARYLALGRGTGWILLDLDARARLPRTVGVFVSGTVRLPLYDARDGFRWGPEVRTTVGATVGPVLERLSFSLGLETQWRAQSSELDLFSPGRLPSSNTGGTWLTLIPSVQVRVLDSVSCFVAVRAPLTQWATGLQFIPGPGVFLGVGGSFEVIGPARPQAKITLGRVTLIDYWATWCEPCLRLKPMIAAARQRYPQLEVREVDATTWDADELGREVPGAAGLPVVTTPLACLAWRRRRRWPVCDLRPLPPPTRRKPRHSVISSTSSTS